ncbi:excalibur calcium-binding domain-containing protein [Streptomyces canus]|uniref:excalibur calcium-binding domain-containing protein n=1 Tax=Streptomyces canus TaxID=58343 RepID=UPI00277F21E5|nr:excalibur calcium-binding domain-containing protein [Streptomyces canus]MDQ0760658.1 hypothetical protein [Streptomyces canus]MDQ1070714.1 hypothetical protein [Streptomyces canus]
MTRPRHGRNGSTDAAAGGRRALRRPYLDRDGDGIACDRPPADFRAHDDQAAAAAEDTRAKGTDLAETGGGGDSTVYLAAAGSAFLLTGGTLVATARSRRAVR